MSSNPEETLRDLLVLEEIDKDAYVSQRTISQSVGIALGLTNSMLKRLIRKGMIKTQTIRANRMSYYLTPDGFTEKMRLLVSYVKLTANFFSTTRLLINNRFSALKEKSDIRTVVILGTGELAEAGYLSVTEHELELIAVCDNKRVGQKWMGKEILRYSAAPEADLLFVADIDIENTLFDDIRFLEVLDIRELFIKDMKAFADVVVKEGK